MKTTNRILFLMLFITLGSCSLQQGYVKLNGKNQKEIITTEEIKKYMRANPNPSIVLKAPTSEDKSTQADQNSYLYNAIEKQLLLEGFDVKDRGLFNEVIGKSKDINYAEIKNLTGTDLILELVRLDTEVPYNTNIYYQKDGKEAVAEEENFLLNGATIEFKITVIDGNKHGGSYLFNYVPCIEKTDDCYCNVAYKKNPNRVYPRLSFCKGEKRSSSKGYEIIPEDKLEKFVREYVSVMVTAIRS
ncbi:hypothetical protein [Aequorivita echinoideorum]|uniref:Lipoprotein n=1 Tax=Aequorivita echinoideorum TaxID=1549647 RepID=A0ABS5S4J1_9FLAO|nr:hypothetical protein [Aequorivita echinoideorum]MBT0607893.1 hypothetical protein [Aequorivita echinoideorum]